MIPAWWIFVALLVPTAAAWVWTAISGDVLDYVLPGICAVALTIALLIFGGAALSVSLGRHYGRVACHTFAAQTHRPTRFVVYTSWDGGDCLTRTAGGKWIPTKNLREFGETP